MADLTLSLAPVRHWMKKTGAKSILFSLFLGVLLLANGCSNDDSETEIADQYLVSSVKVSSYSVAVLQFGAVQAGLSALSDHLTYDISIYKIEYKTQYLGNDIVASGLIGVPDTGTEVPILSFQHGTIAANADAPTVSSEGELYASFASLGYIALIPDLIGFGSSSDLVHPYYHAGYTAQAIIDMIRASKEFIRAEGINSSENVFLAGYSEGGYATMVTHRAIEENYSNEINLIASAPASGGYDIVGMKDYFLSLTTYHQPYYLAFVALSYQTVYDDTELLSNLFNEPYASNIPSLFNGSKSGSQINDALSTEVSVLVKDAFINHQNFQSTYEPFLDHLAANSPIDWHPIHPVYMYHGTKDITVPYDNSVSTYDQLIAGGASPTVVTLTDLPEATHSSGIIPYLINFIAVFENLK